MYEENQKAGGVEEELVALLPYFAKRGLSKIWSQLFLEMHSKNMCGNGHKL